MFANLHVELRIWLFVIPFFYILIVEMKKKNRKKYEKKLFLYLFFSKLYHFTLFLVKEHSNVFCYCLSTIAHRLYNGYIAKHEKHRKYFFCKVLGLQIRLKVYNRFVSIHNKTLFYLCFAALTSSKQQNWL